MTIKEARKIIANAGFSIKKDGNDVLLWGYSKQGLPGSVAFFRADNDRLKRIAQACQVPSTLKGWASPHQRQQEISRNERMAQNGNANTL